MKKVFRIITACFVCVLIAGLPGNVTSLFAQAGYKIDIQIEGFDQDQAFLAYHYWDKQYIQDTTTVKNGRFTFSGSEPLDQGIYMVVLPPKNAYFELIVGADQTFSVKTDTADLAGNIQVDGSEENRVFYEDIQFLAEKRRRANEITSKLADEGLPESEKNSLQNAMKDLNGAVQQARAKLMEDYPELLYSAILKAMKEPEIPEAPVDANGVKDSLFAFRYYKSHFFDHLNLSDPRLVRTPIYYNKINQFLTKLTYQHPDSLNVSVDYLVDRARGDSETFRTVVGNLLNQYAGSKIMGMDAVYVHMVEKFYMTGEAFWADPEQVQKMEERALAISPTLIGRKAPNLNMQDTLGVYQSLNAIQEEYTLLYFWDYDCGHCKKKTPELAKLYKKLRAEGKPVALYAVSINGSIEQWKESIHQYDLRGINVQDHERKTGFDRIYDIRSTPRLFILDKDKVIKAKHIDVDQAEEILNIFMEEEKSR